LGIDARVRAKEKSSIVSAASISPTARLTMPVAAGFSPSAQASLVARIFSPGKSTPWILTSRDTSWTLPARPIETETSREYTWSLPAKNTQWALKSRETGWPLSIRGSDWEVQEK
jgi:hypothetical protein